MSLEVGGKYIDTVGEERERYLFDEIEILSLDSELCAGLYCSRGNALYEMGSEYVSIDFVSSRPPA